MWKWIVGGVVALLVLLLGTCYYGYKKLTAGGDTAIVTIAGSPDRVFASLADPDSMALWMNPTDEPRATTHGLLKPGDTLQIRSAASGRRGAQRSMWLVSEVEPGRLFAVEWRDDSLHRVSMFRRDSLVPNGDSTTIYSTFKTSMFDSIRTARADSGRKPSALLGFGEKVVVAAYRLQWSLELERLKARVEGRPLP